MFARGLGIDLRRLFGRTRQVAIGEFMEERAAHRARRTVLARAVHRDEDAGVGIGEQPEVGVEPDGIAAMRERARSEEHTSELQSLMSISYAVFCLKNK